MTKPLSITLTVALLLIIARGAIDADKVTNCPNVTYNGTWYSGYLDISDSQGVKVLHYWFFPSQDAKPNAPLLLWLNGGPGCSSMLGAIYEHGPFVFIENTTNLVINEYSWNKNAHVIYLESPVGVGYS